MSTIATQNVSVTPYAYWPVERRAAYAETLSHAKDLIPSGLFDRSTGKPSPAKIFLVLETGSMLGLHPMAALQGIDVIEGRASISPQTFTGLVRKAGHKLRIRESGSIGGGDFRVEVELIRSDDPDYPITASWDMDDTLAAGLVDSYAKDPATGRFVVRARSQKNNPLNWEKYPKDMCQWRALGRLARRGGADITMGVGYFPEELEVLVDQDGVREDTIAAEEDLVAVIKAMDDKADLARLWTTHNPKNPISQSRTPDELWTPRVAAAFDAQLMVAPKDSRPGREGAPGHTGAPEIDGRKAEHPLGNDTADAPESTDPPTTEDDTPDEKAPENATQPSAPVETEEERYERESAAEHAAFIASQNTDQ